MSVQIKRALWVYYAMLSAVSGGFAMVFAVNMVYFVEMVNLNPLQLVLVGTTLEVTILFMEVPTGIVADVYSRRRSVIIGYALIGLGFLLSGAIQRFEVILLAQILWGIGYTFTSGARDAWLADEVGEAIASKAYHRSVQVGSVMGIVGIIAGVALATIELNIGILVGGALFIVVAGFLMVFMPENGFKPTSQEDRTTFQKMTGTFTSGLQLVRLTPALIIIMSLSLIDGLYSEGYDRLWTAHLLESFTLPRLGDLDPVVWFGIISILNSLLAIVASEGMQWLIKARPNLSPARIFLGLNSFITLGLFAFAFAPSFGLMIAALSLISTMRAVTEPIYLTWINRHTTSNVRATVISMFGQVNAIGQFAGGPVLGVIGTVYSIRAALTGTGLILSMSLLVLVRRLLGHVVEPQLVPESEAEATA